MQQMSNDLNKKCLCLEIIKISNNSKKKHLQTLFAIQNQTATIITEKSTKVCILFMAAAYVKVCS